MAKNFFFCAFCLMCPAILLFGQVKVTFKTRHFPAAIPGAEHVFVAGDFNTWKPSDSSFEMRRSPDGSFLLSAILPPGVHEFKLTRGSWHSAECTADGQQLANRQLKLGKDTVLLIDVAGWQDNFPAVEKKHTAGPHVRMLSEHFPIPQLGRDRRIWIAVPADYNVSKRSYPVIYMQDGQNLFDAYTAGYGEWGIDEYLDQLPPGQQCLIVGIDHGGRFRLQEYNPYDSRFGKGEGGEYVRFLVETLKPYIDRHFRTRSDARFTTIAGSSMGGLISMYAALKYPQVFGNAGVFSPSFWIAPALYEFARRRHLQPYTRFYFVCGDREDSSEVNDMEKMVRIVRGKGIPAPRSPEVVVSGAMHNEKQWQGDFPAFYRWLIIDDRRRKAR